MDRVRRVVSPLVCALLGAGFLILLLAVVPAPPAQARPMEGIQGKKVVLLMATAPTEKDVIEDLTGVAQSTSAEGLHLTCESRSIIANGSRRSGDYKAALFVPWSSILYVKILD